ncbi:hypothetical protein FNV43_RR05021 [Rhamnella rubrinervis]|uniref:GATA-type domain-containing protein n=1 Tax=Rhamnella rubrinervis TaxID=2594499 RepID=A0A8K0HN53_9ROSA|nr:hypothetical protein FNV43_RR05021 [Rhamnella rubrinervis]
MGMMDLKEKEPLPEEGMDKNKKCCSDCRTTKTPLWRGGPAGPKSLCNACGIRYRKKRISVVGWSKRTQRKREKTNTHDATATNTNTSTAGSPTTSDKSHFLKLRLMALRKEVLQQRSPSVVKKQKRQRRKLGEEEQAAFSLLALSCGSVFA